MYIVINDEPERFVDAKYPNLKPIYEISNYGNVRNKETGKIKHITSLDQDGYVRGSFKATDNSNLYIYIHRLVAWNFCDGYNENKGKIFVNHLDGIRNHNYYKNLVWVTTQENNQHAFQHGNAKPNITHLNGEMNGMCVYSDSFTHEICKMFVSGLTIPDIMHIFGYKTCYSNKRLYDFLRYVKNRKYRKSISDLYDF